MLEKHEADKLDLFFQEKLQHHEISPEEDYWPYLEKSLDKAAFYKFGWKHINIYNVSFGILAIVTSLLYFLLTTQTPEVPQTPITPPSGAPVISDTIVPMPHHSAPPQENPPALFKDRTSGQKNNTKESTPTATPASKPKDSIPAVILPEEFTSSPPQTEEIKKTEEKPKPKKIIYVVQQDTIIEKDTVKVRRKKKN